MIEVLLPKCAEQENCNAVCLEYETGSRNIRMEIMQYTDTIVAIATAMGNSGSGSCGSAVRMRWKLRKKCSAPGKEEALGSCESARFITDMFMMEMRRSMRSF